VQKWSIDVGKESYEVTRGTAVLLAQHFRRIMLGYPTGHLLVLACSLPQRLINSNICIHSQSHSSTSPWRTWRRLRLLTVQPLQMPRMTLFALPMHQSCRQTATMLSISVTGCAHSKRFGILSLIVCMNQDDRMQCTLSFLPPRRSTIGNTH